MKMNAILPQHENNGHNILDVFYPAIIYYSSMSPLLTRGHDPAIWIWTLTSICQTGLQLMPTVNHQHHHFLPYHSLLPYLRPLDSVRLP